MRIDQVVKPNSRFMSKLASDVIDKIQSDAAAGKFQNGKSNYQYKNETYKSYKSNRMVGKTGVKLKAFRNQSVNSQTSYVDMNLTKRTLRGMRPTSNRNTAIVTYDRGEIVLGNAKRGYDIYHFSNKNKEFIVDRFNKEILDRNIKKYTAKTTVIK